MVLQALRKASSGSDIAEGFLWRVGVQSTEEPSAAFGSPDLTGVPPEIITDLGCTLTLLALLELFNLYTYGMGGLHMQFDNIIRTTRRISGGCLGEAQLRRICRP